MPDKVYDGTNKKGFRGPQKKSLKKDNERVTNQMQSVCTPEKVEQQRSLMLMLMSHHQENTEQQCCTWQGC